MRASARWIVALLLAGWLAPFAMIARPADGCCCPAGMHRACMRMKSAGCSLKRCVPRDDAVLVAAPFLLQAAPELPEPVASGSVAPRPAIRQGSAFPDSFDPPPRG